MKSDYIQCSQKNHNYGHFYYYEYVVTFTSPVGLERRDYILGIVKVTIDEG